MSIHLASTVRGLSEKAFRERFGTEEQCVALLLEMRWGRGFCCERCGCKTCTRMKSRQHIQCNGCKHQTGFTAGTVFHSTKLPLTTWFQGIYHLAQSKGGISSIELARRLGVRQPTAWLMKQKLMSVPLRPPGRVPSGSRIDRLADDRWLSATRPSPRWPAASRSTTPIWAASGPAASAVGALPARPRSSPPSKPRPTASPGASSCCR